jgi:oligoendopeptidase F
MTLAETASTFAENLVSSEMLEGVEDDLASRLCLLDDMASRAVTLMLNIRARFLFETRFYRERSKGGPLSSDRLCRLMEDAQREAYMGALDDYHPLFWASKLHFYATDAPFYNWPYTFGFLFSMGVWARARQEGDGFAGRYRRLLEDTGSMSVEELASEHLDADLTDAAFWDAAVAEAVAPAEEATRLLS